MITLKQKSINPFILPLTSITLIMNVLKIPDQKHESWRESLLNWKAEKYAENNDDNMKRRENRRGKRPKD